MTTIKTGDVYDSYGDTLQVAAPVFRRFGRRGAFAGPIATAKVFYVYADADGVVVSDKDRGSNTGTVLV